MGQCEEEGRRRGEGEGEVRRERERAGDLERRVKEGREREESLHSEIQAMTEVSRISPRQLLQYTIMSHKWTTADRDPSPGVSQLHGIQLLRVFPYHWMGMYSKT